MHRLPQELVAEINGLEALDARALHRHYRAVGSEGSEHIDTASLI